MSMLIVLQISYPHQPLFKYDDQSGVCYQSTGRRMDGVHSFGHPHFTSNQYSSITARHGAQRILPFRHYPTLPCILREMPFWDTAPYQRHRGQAMQHGLVRLHYYSTSVTSLIHSLQSARHRPLGGKISLRPSQHGNRLT